MTGHKLNRKILASLFLLFQPVVASAASITEQYSAGGLEGLLVGLFNSVTVVELASTQDVAIMIGVFAVFYFIELNLVETIFNTIQSRVGRGKSGSRPRFTTSEGEYPTGTKGLAVAIAFITSQGIAFVVGLWGTAAIGIIGFLIFLIAKFSFLGTFFGGFVPQSVRNGVGRRIENTIAGDDPGNGGGDNPAPDGGAAVDQIQDQIGQMEDRLDSVEDLAKSVDQELREIVREEEDLEQMKSRLGDKVSSGKLSRDEARRLSEIIDETEEVEQLEEKVENFIENVLNEEEHIAELEEHISRLEREMESGEADISRIENEIGQVIQQSEANYQDLQQELNRLRERLEQGEIDPQKFQQEMEQLQPRLQQGWRTASSLKQYVDQAENIAQQVEQEASETEQEVEEAETEVSDAEEKLDKVQEGISREEAEVRDEEEKTSDLPAEHTPDELVKAEEDEQNVAVKEEKEDEEALEVAREEESIVKAEEQELANIENTLGKQEQGLQKYSQRIQQLVNRYKQQQQQLQEVEQIEAKEDEQVKRGVTQVRKEMQNILQGLRSGGIDMSEEDILRETKAAEQRLAEIRNSASGEENLSAINETENIIGLIRKQIGEEHEGVSQVIEQLNQLTQEVGSSNRDPNQIYSDAQQLLNQIDRSQLPQEEAERLGNAERKLFEALQSQGMDVERMWS